MSRIDRRLEEVRASGRRALVAYVMAGYPAMEDTPAVVRGLVRGGADIVEIGHPFSDPMADGPVIQRAATASLEGGTTVATTLEAVRRIRAESDVPMVLMTYTNILYRYGYDRFMADAADAGIDGYILPDMSIEESGVYLDAARRQGASAIFLVSPNTEGTRIRRIAAASSGFLYMVAVYGTTGSSQGVRDYSVRAIRRAKEITGGAIPLGVGFGISSPEDIRRCVEAGADAVIVGSAILRLIEETPREDLEEAVAAFVASLREPLGDQP